MRKTFLVVLACAVAAGCGGAKSQLVGSWRVDKSQISSLNKDKFDTSEALSSVRVQFKSDGTYQADPAGERGTYTVDGHTITILPSPSQSAGSVGPTTKATLSEDGKTLTINLGLDIKLTKANG